MKTSSSDHKAQWYPLRALTLPQEFTRYQIEYASRLSRRIATLAIDAMDASLEVSRSYMPKGFQELVISVMPTANPEILYRNALTQARVYLQPWRGDGRSPHEKITQSRTTIDLADGRVVTLRTPCETDTASLGELYEGLSRHDSYTRFFASLSPAAARKAGVGCSVLKAPSEACDFVIVDDEGHIGGHAGYMLSETGDANLHITVAPSFRVATTQGERLSEVLFEQAIAAATLDLRVTQLSAETLVENVGVNKLIGHTLGVREGYQTRMDYGCIESSAPVTH